MTRLRLAVCTLSRECVCARAAVVACFHKQRDKAETEEKRVPRIRVRAHTAAATYTDNMLLDSFTFLVSACRQLMAACYNL